MKFLQTLELVLLPLLCASGFALATPWSVQAPEASVRHELPTRVPADRYLDLGAVQKAAYFQAYQPPTFSWEREAGRAMSRPESCYIDVARQRP